ncbi:BtrH N-terminal domain-containing protein [Halocatena salina]|uniref:BtrH N-terminal domain-containing protein n=1 Tax=Halocatena salina TaxID=2934340 RepID=A0A8T9ZZP1_9EURY|nr:BtrH N-terminal domain-containing protein [Halocatena salina]UPM42272.1 BtrH N-terminal domain-containing protein [Halocatena salina]
MQLSGYDHSPGRHCGSVSLRNLSEFYGWGFDEPTCFGLASGLGFTFFELSMDPHRAFFGRPFTLERAFMQRLGVDYTEREGEKWETAWSAVQSHLEAGRPVLLFLDIYDLDYFGTDTHFAPHAVLAVGYDDTHVLLSDSEFPTLQSLPLASLRSAWRCDPVVPMSNRYLVVTDADPVDFDFENAVREATHWTACSMIDPERRSNELGRGRHGLPAIRALAAELPTWLSLPDPSWTTRFAYQNVERRGTGGGAFRGLQRDFFERVDHPFGSDVTERMAAIADDWTEVGTILKEASEADDDGLRDGLEEAATELETIADREKALYETIRSME